MPSQSKATSTLVYGSPNEASQSRSRPIAPDSIIPVGPAPIMGAPIVTVSTPPPAPVPTIVPPPPSSRGAGRSSKEALASLASELRGFASVKDAAAHALTIAAELTGARAGLALFYDMDTREFVVVSALGAGSNALVKSRYAEDDPLLAAAVFDQSPALVSCARRGRSAPSDRHIALGARAGVVVAPVVSWGRCLAVIELIDPQAMADNPARVGSTVRVVAERFAENLAERGIVVGFRIPAGRAAHG